MTIGDLVRWHSPSLKQVKSKGRVFWEWSLMWSIAYWSHKAHILSSILHRCFHDLRRYVAALLGEELGESEMSLTLLPLLQSENESPWKTEPKDPPPPHTLCVCQVPRDRWHWNPLWHGFRTESGSPLQCSAVRVPAQKLSTDVSVL